MSAPYAGARPCKGCGQPTPLQSGRAGQPRKWCSNECRDAAYSASRSRSARPTRTAADRVRARLAQVPGGCLEFTGYRNAAGYGVVSTSGGTALAHRVIWQDRNGPIGDGLSLRHSCDNPACCNLDHLEVGTHADNMRDRDVRGRTLRGESAPHAKLTDQEVREIRASSDRSAAIAARYGISRTHVSYIRNYRTRLSA